VIGAAFFSGASEAGRAGFLLRPLGLSGQFMIARRDGSKRVNAKGEATATVERYNLGAQAAGGNVARPVRAGGPDVNPAKVYPDFLGAHLAFNRQGNNAKIRALGACPFNVRACDVD
tara:strand:+ start:1115 stop:1465 length:351 start_codon:yes stop_codon:yes gene_type:complete